MNLEQKKILLTQRLLRVEDEAIIDRLENLLRELSIQAADNNLKPITKEELDQRIDQSEDDIANGKFSRAEDLVKKHQR